MTNQVDLGLLTEAANLLMGHNGALQLAAVYATLEKVSKDAYKRGEDAGAVFSWEAGYYQALRDGSTVSIDDNTVNPYPTDIYQGRFHRPGEHE